MDQLNEALLSAHHLQEMADALVLLRLKAAKVMNIDSTSEWLKLGDKIPVYTTSQNIVLVYTLEYVAVVDLTRHRVSISCNMEPLSDKMGRVLSYCVASLLALTCNTILSTHFFQSDGSRFYAVCSPTQEDHRRLCALRVPVPLGESVLAKVRLEAVEEEPSIPVEVQEVVSKANASLEDFRKEEDIKKLQ